MVVMETGNMANIDLPAPDKIVPKTLSPEFDKQWGLDAARFREAHRLTKGRGVRVAVLDTGIDMTHPVFQDTVWGSHYNFVGRDGLPWVEDGPPMVDWGWHGTVVTSIVAKYAPEARITLYRYLDGDSQNDSPFPIIVTNNMGAAIYKAVHDGNDIINISAGTGLHTPYLEEACRYAWENNVIIVTGSPYYQGRYLGGAEDYPAQYPTTIAATAIDRLAENKYGYWEIAAPDPMTTVGSPNAPFVAFPAYSGETDIYAPGISCATPIVASLAALAASAYPRLGTEPPGQYVETIRRLLTENANSRMVGFDGFSPECGFGMIDAVTTVEAALELGAARPVRDPLRTSPLPLRRPRPMRSSRRAKRSSTGPSSWPWGFTRKGTGSCLRRSRGSKAGPRAFRSFMKTWSISFSGERRPACSSSAEKTKRPSETAISRFAGRPPAALSNRSLPKARPLRTCFRLRRTGGAAASTSFLIPWAGGLATTRPGCPQGLGAGFSG